MSRIHDVLRWANRREVAREVTQRGYRVSGETLNRWVRDEAEFPAVVQAIVFDLFTITGHSETAAPEWAAAMEERLSAQIVQNRDLIGRLARPELVEAAERVIERLEALGPPSDEAPHGGGALGGRGVATPPGPRPE